MSSRGSSTSLHARRAADRLEEIAAEWIARRNGAGFRAADEAELQRWLDADFRHATAFAAMEGSWQALNQPRHTGHAERLWADTEIRDRRRRRRRRMVGAGAGTVLAAAASIALVFSLSSPPPPVAAAPSFSLRPDRQVLPDGSSVELNSGAEINVQFTAGKRAVALLRGEALFSVAKDFARPFVVSAGSVEVRAVGTAFTVRHDQHHIGVVVTEGRVAVDRAAAPRAAAPAGRDHAEPIYLSAGRKVIVPLDRTDERPREAVALTPAEIGAALAWRDKRVEFTDTALPDALALFNRHNRVQLSLADPALTRRSITGIFWADDPEGFVRLLQRGFKIHSERAGDTFILRGE